MTTTAKLDELLGFEKALAKMGKILADRKDIPAEIRWSLFGALLELRLDETPADDAKSPRGPMPLDFLPFEAMELVYNHSIEFDDETELLHSLAGLAA